MTDDSDRPAGPPTGPNGPTGPTGPNGSDEAVDDDWYGEADPRVPDASAWPDRDLRFLGDDVYLGEEAQIPAELAGSHVPSVSAVGAAELRELERRLEQQRT
ncbi:MAG: hypothetical protein H7138_27105, partial [Myxococcales bacterium]|nr:hypothetical protein [Myxococcales bacterium]